jgi:uncharacterized membrane-anchored protein YhcB (DUF1043 family)
LPGQETVELFAKYGGLIGLLMGVIIVGCGALIYLLWKRIHDKDQRIAELTARLEAVQEKRVDEAKAVRAELIELANDFTKAVHEMSAASNALKDVVLMGERR